MKTLNYEANLIRSILSAGYELGDGKMDGAMLVLVGDDWQWWEPKFGCDSLQCVMERVLELFNNQHKQLE